MTVVVVKRALAGPRKRGRPAGRKSTQYRVVRDLVVIPADVFPRWAHRPQPRDLTAAICGDPLPGRSALDRMGGRFVD